MIGIRNCDPWTLSHALRIGWSAEVLPLSLSLSLRYYHSPYVFVTALTTDKGGIEEDGESGFQSISCNIFRLYGDRHLQGYYRMEYQPGDGEGEEPVWTLFERYPELEDGQTGGMLFAPRKVCCSMLQSDWLWSADEEELWNHYRMTVHPLSTPFCVSHTSLCNQN